MLNLKSFNIITAALLTFAFGTSVPAQGAGDKSILVTPISQARPFVKRALVVGVRDYRHAAKLNDTTNDARDFYNLLLTKFKFPAESITLMVDDPGTPEDQVPTHTELLNAIDNLLAGTNENSEVIVFFSGHGIRSDNQDWLIPQDGLPNNVPQSCISYTDLKNQLTTRRPHRALLFVDACRDIQDGKGVASSGFKGGGALTGGVAEIVSCQASEVSREGRAEDFSEGVFTHFLIKGLSGDADAVAAGGEFITYDSLKQYVQGNVSQYVQNYYQAPQNPDGLASLGAMVIAKAAPTTPTVQPTPIIEPVPGIPAPRQLPTSTLWPPHPPAVQAGSIPAVPITAINPKDGAEMIYIPSGEFTMGANDNEEEQPVHRVNLDGYWMYKTPVTVAQYQKFCTETGRQMPQEPNGTTLGGGTYAWTWQGHENHPIVNVSWVDATAYCDWAQASLPTEAEWEKAARGTDGRKFPWGETFDSSRLWWASSPEHGDAMSTDPVGSFPTGASPYGCLDMAGNVEQWCADWYNPDYYNTAPASNPTGPGAGNVRAVRGGTWRNDGSGYFRCAGRGNFDPARGLTDLGFRCCVRDGAP